MTLVLLNQEFLVQKLTKKSIFRKNQIPAGHQLITPDDFFRFPQEIKVNVSQFIKFLLNPSNLIRIIFIILV